MKLELSGICRKAVETINNENNSNNKYLFNQERFTCNNYSNAKQQTISTIIYPVRFNSIYKNTLDKSKDPYCEFVVKFKDVEKSFEGDIFVEYRELSGKFSKVKLEGFPDENTIKNWIRLTFNLA